MDKSIAKKAKYTTIFFGRGGAHPGQESQTVKTNH